MKLLKSLVRVLPLGFLKVRLYRKLKTRLIEIDNNFASSKKRYVDNIRDLYDCMQDVSVTLVEDFNKFKVNTIDSFFPTSQTLADLILELLDNKRPKWDSFIEADMVDRRRYIIDWYSNRSSVKIIGDHGLQVINYYINYITYKDAVLSGEVPQEVPYSPELVSFFESKNFKLLVSDLITAYRTILDSNVSR